MTVSDEIRSAWETTDGGFVPEFDATVREATFMFDNSYQNGEACLLELLVEPSEDDAPEFGDYLEDGLYRIIYTCGKGWEPADKGATCQHESGKARKFASQSGMGLLMNAALEIDGMEQILLERGRPTEAGVWVGLGFHFENKEFEGKNRDGDPITWSRRLPTAFLGADEGEEAEEKAKPAAKKAPAKKAPAKKVEETDDEGDTYALSPKVKGQLRGIAARVADHDEFMEAAFAEVTLDDDGETAVADEEFYLSLKAG